MMAKRLLIPLTPQIYEDLRCEISLQCTEWPNPDVGALCNVAHLSYGLLPEPKRCAVSRFATNDDRRS
jgi:hypothetical protein